MKKAQSRVGPGSSDAVRASPYYTAQKTDPFFAQISAPLLGKGEYLLPSSVLVEAAEWSVLAV
jgi:hypothetical protein